MGSAGRSSNAQLGAAATDRTRPEQERIDALSELGRRFPKLQYMERKAVYGVLHDRAAPIDLRILAAGIVAGYDRGAVNHLTRSFSGDPQRRLRAAALDLLRNLPRPPFDAALRSRIEDAVSGDGMPSNLPGMVGHLPEVVDALHTAARHGDTAERRGGALIGLAQLGEMDEVRAATVDADAAIRLYATRALGAFTLGVEEDVAALEARLDDADGEVRSEATRALRLLGRRATPQPRPAQPAARHDPPGARHPWGELLSRWSLEWLADAEFAAGLDEEVVRSGWLGSDGASDAGIAAVEERLGTTLPPSYREFLRVSDGWLKTTPLFGRLLRASELRWFADAEPEWVAAYDYEAARLRPALMISEPYDGGVYLLIPPATTAPDAEWQACRFANWIPGIEAQPSFWELMRAEHEIFLMLRNAG